jgi:hypothetical protein
MIEHRCGNCMYNVDDRAREPHMNARTENSDPEPATGHQFLCLKHFLAISKILNRYLNPQEGQMNIFNKL